jgi:hypothetical protein
MSVPQQVLDKFYEGKASEFSKFGVSASVKVTSGPHKEKRGSVVSLETLQPVPKYLVEFSDGSDALINERDLIGD